MGTTYRAFDEELNRPVVLKIIRADLTDDLDLRKRFTREVQAIAKLSHPGIIKIFDYQDSAGLSFYSMELIEGKSLADRIEEKVFSPVEATEFIVKVTDALMVVHGAGILHRDIKPDNILISAEGLPVIIDFGLANYCEDEARTCLTRTGQIVGTFNFVPPEIITGLQEKRRADQRGDIYQLGVVFYQMVTGELPYSNRELLKLLRAPDLLPPKLPSSFSDEADDDFDKLVLKALDIDPQLRYGTVQKFQMACQRWLGNEPLESGVSPPLPEQEDETNAVSKVTLQKDIKPKPLIASVLAMLFIIIALALLTSKKKMPKEEETKCMLKSASVEEPQRLLFRFNGIPKGRCILTIGKDNIEVDLSKGKQLSKTTFGLEIDLSEPLLEQTNCRLSVEDTLETTFSLSPERAIAKELELVDKLTSQNLTQLFKSEEPDVFIKELGFTKDSCSSLNMLIPKLIGRNEGSGTTYEKRLHPLFMAEMALVGKTIPWTNLTKLLGIEYFKSNHPEKRTGWKRIYDKYLIKSIRDKEKKERRRESLWFTHKAYLDHMERTGFRTAQQSAHTFNLMSKSVGGAPIKRIYVTDHVLHLPLPKLERAPRKVRLALTFQGWDMGLYFTVSVNGCHPIPVYFTNDFGFMLSPATASFPLPPDLLHEGDNEVRVRSFAAPETQTEADEVSLIYLSVDALPK